MIVSNIEEAIKALNFEIEKLKNSNKNNKALMEGNQNDKIKKLFYYYELKEINPHILNSNTRFQKEPENLKEVENYYQAKLEKIKNLKEKMLKQHQKNIPYLEHNDKIVKAVYQIMEKIGISSVYLKKTGKTRIRKTKELAGFVNDLKRVIITDDNYFKYINELKEIEEKLDKTKEKYIKEIKEKELKELQLKKERKKELTLLKLYDKYDLNYNDDLDIEYLLEGLTNKDKYLMLASALEENRNDWSDGYSIVEHALNNFKIETEEDKLIYEEITSVIFENWDGDGRIFRDMKYSYTTLYNMVKDKELLKDYFDIKNMKNE